MQIIVVGAGIGGLSAALALSLSGHTITILESSPALAEVGAGVQLTPNATKAFWKWGLGPSILEHAVLPSSFNIRDLETGKLIRGVEFEGFMERYGGPYVVVHRADIHRILYGACVKAGVRIELGRKVVTYDVEGGRVRVEDGREMSAELVVACDGIHSFARRTLNPSLKYNSNGLEKSGWAAYRKIVPVAALKSNPLTKFLTEDYEGNCWVGENKLVMTYLVKGASLLNIVLSHPDDVDTTEWSPERYDIEIREFYKEAEPRLKAVIELSNPGAQNWPVEQVKNLPRWKSESGRFVLMGDVVHAMPFYLSMGVSMAVEDAETLAECIALKKLTTSSLEKAMAVFEGVRKPRAEAVRDASLHAGDVLQMRKGPEREVRDRAIRDDGVAVGVEEEEGDDFYVTRTSYGIADRKIRDWCYGYNVAEEVLKQWF